MDAIKGLACLAALVGMFAVAAWLDADAEIDLARELASEAARAPLQMDERERARAEMLAALRAAYQQGLADGAERERMRARATR
jgi:hypothetical protein